jgi:hypothetical protein
MRAIAEYISISPCLSLLVTALVLLSDKVTARYADVAIPTLILPNRSSAGGYFRMLQEFVAHRLNSACSVLSASAICFHREGEGKLDVWNESTRYSSTPHRAWADRLPLIANEPIDTGVRHTDLAGYISITGHVPQEHPIKHWVCGTLTVNLAVECL